MMLEPMIRLKLPLATWFGRAIFSQQQSCRFDRDKSASKFPTVVQKKWQKKDQLCVLLRILAPHPWTDSYLPYQTSLDRGERGGANGSIRFSPEIGMGANNGLLASQIQVETKHQEGAPRAPHFFFLLNHFLLILIMGGRAVFDLLFGWCLCMKMLSLKYVWCMIVCVYACCIYIYMYIFVYVLVLCIRHT